MTSREGGPKRGRWFEAPFLLRAGSSNCDGTCGPGNGRRGEAGDPRRPSSERVSAGPPGPSPGPRPPSAPDAQPPPPPPPALRRPALQSSAAPVGPAAAIPSSGSQSALPHTGILFAPASGWGLNAVPLLPPCVSGPSPFSLC